MTAMLQFDTDTFSADFPHRPFAIGHGLSDHPLLSLQALVALARRMDRDRIEYNSGKLQPNQRPEDTPGIDMAPDEVVRRIEDAGAWLVLKNVETMPQYRMLLETALTDLACQQGFSSLKQAGISDVQGFIFVSSAGSVTPFHVDYEHNFFVHLHGPKAMHIFDNEDRSLVSEEALETSPGKHRNLQYRDEFETRATVFRFKPGQGVFLPYIWPHWVETGTNGYTISMAVTWKTPEVLRDNKLRVVNAVLRNLGAPQDAPGRHPAFDTAKVMAYTAARAVIDPLRGSERSRRFLRGLIFGRKANYYYGAKT